MISPLAAAIALGVYAGLLAVGGIMGFVKAGSKPSLIAGVSSAVVALIALGLTLSVGLPGLVLGLVLAVALLGMFGYRYAAKGRKFMPSGLLALVSLAMVGLLVLALGGAR